MYDNGRICPPDQDRNTWRVKGPRCPISHDCTDVEPPNHTWRGAEGCQLHAGVLLRWRRRGSCRGLKVLRGLSEQLRWAFEFLPLSLHSSMIYSFGKG